MDESPEATMVLRTLKDFDKFITSGNKAAGSRRDSISATNSRLRLNFSDINESSILNDDSNMPSSRKRTLDSLTGLDITKRFREKDTELAEAKANITMLKGRLNNTEVANKRARLENESELESLRQKQSRDKELIDDLQHKIRRLQASQKEFSDGARKYQQQCNNPAHEAAKKIMAVEQKYIEENEGLQEEMEYLKQQLMDLQTEVEEKNFEIERKDTIVDELKEQLIRAESKTATCAANQLELETVQLQLQQAKAKVKNLQIERDELNDVQKKSQIFEAAVAKMYILEKENKKLREENKFFKDTALNTKLLEEKNVELKQQIMLLESRCQDVAHYQAKADQYKSTLKVYEEAMREELNLGEKPTVQELRSQISKLKKEDFNLTCGIEQLCASQKSLEKRRMQEENEIKILQSNIDKQKAVAQQNMQIIKRLQRKVLLLTQERDSLKKIITTYEAELTINHSVVSQERIERLENHLQSYRDELKLMEEELEEAYKSAVGGTSSPSKRDKSERVLSMEKKLSELEQELKKMSEMNATLTEANEKLEGKIENLTQKGDYDPTSTKVLHFKNNPLALAEENRTSHVENLEKEVEVLRNRVRLLEEGEQHDLTQKVDMKISSEGSSKDIINLQEQISLIETRNKRLMEVFKKKSLEMREAIYLLTGYRVDSTTEGQYKLTNMYSETSEDFFMFEYQSDGELHLLETPFSETLEDFVEIYLSRKHSLPAFLSAVTLDLFRKQSLDSPVSGNEEEIHDEEDMDDEEQQRQQLVMMAHRQEFSEEQMAMMGHRQEFDDEQMVMMGHGQHMQHYEDEEEEMEDEEELDEEEEEEHEGEEEPEEDDGDDLICLD